MKLALVSMKSSSNSLPDWKEPKDLAHAALSICELGRNMHEHAYLVGQTLLWVQKKVGNRKFTPWLKNNVWFKNRTAFRTMAFAKSCNKKTQMLEYHQCLKDTDKPKKESKSKSTEWDGQALFHLMDWLRAELTRWPENRRDEAAHFIREVLKEFKL